MGVYISRLGASPGFVAHLEPWLAPKRLIDPAIPTKVDNIGR